MRKFRVSVSYLVRLERIPRRTEVTAKFPGKKKKDRGNKEDEPCDRCAARGNRSGRRGTTADRHAKIIPGLCTRSWNARVSSLSIPLGISAGLPAAPASQFRCSDTGVAHRSLRGVSTVKETKNSNQKRACQGIDYGTPRSHLATKIHIDTVSLLNGSSVIGQVIPEADEKLRDSWLSRNSKIHSARLNVWQ